jgi:IS1 family transposase
MGAALSELVSLLQKYNIAEKLADPDCEYYRQIMESICHSTGRGTHMIERSHQLDLAAYLAVLPETYTSIQ